MSTLLDTIINSRLEATGGLSTSSLRFEASGNSTSTYGKQKIHIFVMLDHKIIKNRSKSVLRQQLKPTKTD